MQKIVDKLLALANNSYSPYSHFRVATILIMKDGKEFYGVNVESSNYGSTICSERSAIVSAISTGYQKGDFKELHCLCADSKKISVCCFECRQVISELFDEDAILYFYNNDGSKKKYFVKDLCPYPFNESDLK